MSTTSMAGPEQANVINMASATHSTTSKVMIPGLSAPLGWTPGSEYVEGEDNKTKKLFPSALDTDGYDYSLKLVTLREIVMLQLMNQLTDKPNWETKIFDDTISAKWREEALAVEEHDLTEEMVDWVLEELKYKAKIFDVTGAVSVYNGDVVKSDTVIPQSLKESLRAAVKPLENIPEVHVDYHPGSDGKVIDLVHPSLFPMIYGRSRVLEDGVIGLEDCFRMVGKGKIIEIEARNQMLRADFRNRGFFGNAPTPRYSWNFQWLPCEVEMSADGETVKIASYINNLHPRKYGRLYAVLEQLISRVIPLWNMTLTPTVDYEFRFKRIIYNSVEYDPHPETLPEEERLQQGEDEDEDDFWEREEEWLKGYRQSHLVLPVPKKFEPPKEDILSTLLPESTEKVKGVNLRNQFSTKNLQIVVKLANIQLTPEKPSYEGGTWHVEGQMNEHICATALYYYDNENITESRLTFRQRGSEESRIDVMYEQGDHYWARVVYGIANEESTTQTVGDVVCKEGRLLTFPNILQHRVAPFKLEDSSKPGHRKIVALFLVDPNITVISTAHVPPQRRDWWSEEVIATGSLDRLPRELQNKLMEDVDDFPIGLDEAKEIRVKLMEERKTFVIDQTGGFEGATFSLCEH